MKNKQDILDSFWKLSEQQDSIRLDAASRILQNLRTKSAENDSETVENETNGVSSLSYCTERLIRGLASTRASSIQGYFVCLVALLKQHEEELPLEDVFKIIEKVLHIKGSKSEEGEYMRGKVLAYGAVARSGRASPEQIGVICQKLLNLSNKRSYLTVPANRLIVESFSQVSEKDFSASVWPQIADIMKSKADSLEMCWLALEIDASYTGVLGSKKSLEVFDRKKWFDSTFIDTFVNHLLSGSFPIHLLMKLPIVGKFVTKLLGENRLEEFWMKTFEPLVSKESQHKSSVAMIVLNSVVFTVNDPDLLPELFTTKIVDVVLQNLSNTKDTDVESVILSMFDKLIDMAAAHPPILKPILKSLLTGSGNVAFDKLTGSTIVQRLTGVGDANAVKFVADIYLQALLGHQLDSQDQPTSKEKTYAAQQLAKLCSHSKLNGETDWKITIISNILALTLFEIKKPILSLKKIPKPFTREARVELKPVFFKALDTKADTLEKLCDVLYGVAMNASKLLKSSNAAVPLTPLASESQAAWKQMIDAVEKIREEASKNKEDTVFQLLFIHLGFQLFSDPAMAIDVLSDLHICYAKSKQKRVKHKKNSNAEPEWIEVVIDLLLSLLAQNKHVLRLVVSSVMTVLSPHMTDSALQAIIDVIHPAKSDISIKSEPDDEEDLSDDENYETVSESDGEEEQDIKVEQEDEDSDGDEDEDEDEDSGAESDGEVNEELRTRVKNALGPHADVSSDQESIDMDDLDDESMMKIDAALSNIFKSLCKKKSSAEKKKEQKDLLAQMHFRIRALDIVDVYLSHNPKLSHVMALIQPVIAALEESIKIKDHLPLQNRLMTSLKKITNLKKLPLDKSVKHETFKEMLQSMIDWANTGSAVYPLLCHPIPLFAQCCSFLLKYGEKFEEENKKSPELVDIYTKALEDFFVKNHCPLAMSFFLIPVNGGAKGVSKWCNIIADHAFSAETRPYRKTQALTLLAALLRSPIMGNSDHENEQKTLVATVSQRLQKELESCLSSEEEIKPKYLIELLHLALQLHNASSEMASDLKEPLDSVRKIIPKNRHFHDIRKAFNKMSLVYDIKPVQQNEKNKENSNNEKKQLLNGNTMQQDGDAEIKKKKKKKKKPSKETLKKRKEAKIFALEGQFKGQEMPSFSGIVMNANMNFEMSNGPSSNGDLKETKKRKKGHDTNGTKKKKKIAE